MAISSSDGEKAFALARLISQCETMQTSVTASYSHLHSSAGSAALQNAYKKNLDEDQRLLQQCQSLSGNIRQMRLDLLKIAMDSGTRNSAASYISLADTTKLASSELARIYNIALADAKKGDLASAWLVAYNPESPINAGERAAISAAMLNLATDSEIGDAVKRYLSVANSIYPSGAPRFDENDANSVKLRDFYTQVIKETRRRGVVGGS